jgi:hypothetical protein
MTPAQVVRYSELRGYTTGGPAASHGAHRH